MSIEGLPPFMPDMRLTEREASGAYPTPVEAKDIVARHPGWEHLAGNRYRHIASNARLDTWHGQLFIPESGRYISLIGEILNPKVGVGSWDDRAFAAAEQHLDGRQS
jgi:hypothetical protein